MATRATTAPARAASPEIDPVSSAASPTRRGLLALAAGAVTIATPALALVPVSGPHSPVAADQGVSALLDGGSRQWEAVLQAFEQADASLNQFYAEVFNPAVARFDAISGWPPKLEYTHVARSGRAATFRFLPDELDEAAESFIHGRHVAPIRDAWRAYEVRLNAAEREIGLRAIELEEDRRTEEWKALRNIVRETPAPTLAALRTKVALMREHDADRDHAEWIARDLGVIGG